MTRKPTPELVYREGKPVAVIVDIGAYREMLERLDDIEDLREIEAMRHDTSGDRPLDDILAELGIGV